MNFPTYTPLTDDGLPRVAMETPRCQGLFWITYLADPLGEGIWGLDPAGTLHILFISRIG